MNISLTLNNFIHTDQILMSCSNRLPSISADRGEPPPEGLWRRSGKDQGESDGFSSSLLCFSLFLAGTILRHTNLLFSSHPPGHKVCVLFVEVLCDAQLLSLVNFQPAFRILQFTYCCKKQRFLQSSLGCECPLVDLVWFSPAVWEASRYNGFLLSLASNF